MRKFSGEQVDDTSPAVMEDQRNNPIDPSVTCAVTSLSIMIQSKGMGKNEIRQGREIENDILADLKTRYPQGHKALREDFNFLAKYAQEKYGVALKYKGMNKNDWISKILNDAEPFMTSTSNALTPFGHIVVSRGLKTEPELLLCFNDPYGFWPYKDKKASGEKVYYKASQFPFDDGKGTQKIYHTLSYV
jgi:hypothetical protein